MGVDMPCLTELLDRIPVGAVAAEPATASLVLDGLVGARVWKHSEAPPEAWHAVVVRPEDQDAWMPPSFGVQLVERLDANHVYQHVDIPVLMGAIHIRRQVLVGNTWLSASPVRAQNCFWSEPDVAPWAAATARWPSEEPWLRPLHGGWLAEAAPEGGSTVSYQVWTEAKFLVPGLQSWAMARTLPELIDIFDGEVRRRAGLGPAGGG
jgi:hypothetical protein